MPQPPARSALFNTPEAEAGTHLIETDLRLIRVVLWALLGVAAPISLISNIVLSGPLLPRILTPCAIILIALSALWLLRRQRTNAAINLFLWGLGGLILIQTLLINGIRTPIAAAFPIIVMLSAWASSKRNTLVLGTMIVMTLIALAALDDTYWAEQVPRNGWHFLSTYLVTVVLGGILASHLGSALRRNHAAQVRTSETLTERVKELAMEREKFSTFFFLNPVPVSISLLANGSYFDVNPAWEKLSGWTKSELIGKTSTQIGLWITQAERDAWIAEFSKHGKASNQLLRFRLRDGKIRHFVANCETINYDGQACIFAAFLDVTERREAEEALRQLNAKLEDRVRERTERLAEANQSLANSVDSLQRTQDDLVRAETMASLGAMVAGISHELNTPIGNALTVASALEEQSRSMSKNFEHEQITRSNLQKFLADQLLGTELAVSNLRRVSELVRSFKQVAVDQTSERRRHFDLRETVQDVLDTLRPMLRFKPIELSSNLPAGVELDSYPGPLGQIISNLLQNALLHGLGEQAQGVVTLSACEDEAGHVLITLRDNGKGISEEHLGRIFDPFFTTRLGQGGSGLGLAIVYRLSTQVLGGSISVDSQPGQGATFTLRIPKLAPGKQLYA